MNEKQSEKGVPIKADRLVFSSFNWGEAKPYIGEKCYFTNSFYEAFSLPFGDLCNNAPFSGFNTKINGETEVNYPVNYPFSTPIGAYAFLIVPIKQEPQYVPFTWEDRDLFLGKFCHKKSWSPMDSTMVTGTTGTTGVREDNGDSRELDTLELELSSGITETLVEFLKSYVFLDGSPCGKKVNK